MIADLQLLLNSSWTVVVTVTEVVISPWVMLEQWKFKKGSKTDIYCRQ